MAQIVLDDISLATVEDMIKSSRNLSIYDREFRAYSVSSFVAQKERVNGNAKGTEYWNKGWGKSDAETERVNGIKKIIKNYYGATEECPGQRMIEPRK